MKQRGRSSAAGLSVVVNPGFRRIEPPADLSATEAKLFREIVGACFPDHFTTSDVHLLVSYVQATLSSRHYAKASRKNPKFITAWDKSTRMQSALAMRLRLAPQSRVDPKTLSRKVVRAHQSSAYEGMTDE